ncbi:hypothetical protein ACWC1D_00915 [Streptomyces sp. NPDC001478]
MSDRDAMEELIEAKLGGLELPTETDSGEAKTGQVVDLMTALNASMKQARESNRRAPDLLQDAKLGVGPAVSAGSAAVCRLDAIRGSLGFSELYGTGIIRSSAR